MATYGEMERLIVANLHLIRQLGSGVIVHLPRSGTAPAAMIATYLPAPLASVDEYCAGILPDRKCPEYDRNRVILVDDCINRGAQALAAIDRIKAANQNATITVLAVYDSARIGKPRKFNHPLLTLDRHAGDDTANYLYSYYVWKGDRLRHLAVDFDGVLCRDATADEDDDGERYATFLKNVEPKFLPMDGKNCPLGAIVTARLEKYRAQTAEWLNRHGVTYNALHMGPWKDQAERKGKVAKWKAGIYAAIGNEIRLFVESSDAQAAKMHAISRKPVFSVELMKLYQC